MKEIQIIINEATGREVAKVFDDETFEVLDTENYKLSDDKYTVYDKHTGEMACVCLGDIELMMKNGLGFKIN
ncbi:MAG: hypothetical protein IKM44_04230 [Clostridia bacterium]|nr:hypothetical protein [Clostridia bacterium]